MKKRISTIIAALMVLMILGAEACFAAGFGIESTTPENGAKNTTKENLCVKIIFTEEVGNDESAAANKDKFRIVDENGKEFPALIYYNKEDPKYALILADTTKIPESGKEAIQDATEYTCVIDSDFRDNAGDTLGQEQRISFTTMNQGQGMIVYMVLMVGMMVAMMGLTFYQTKKEAEEQAREKIKEAGFNPYKEAKETGKTVEQVIAEHEKKDKKNKKPELEEKQEEPLESDHYRVKRPRPISEAGSTYKTGRKAKAEAEARRMEEEKQQRKAEGYGKKKSDKQEADNKKKKKGGKK